MFEIMGSGMMPLWLSMYSRSLSNRIHRLFVLKN